METAQNADRQQKIQDLADKILRLAHDGLLIHMRFLDVALSKLPVECRPGMGAHLFDGERLYCDPLLLIKNYEKEAASAARLYLHTLLHQVFYHGFQKEKQYAAYWDLATDIAVEATILELGLSVTRLTADEELKSSLSVLKRRTGGLTAEKIYRHFRIEEPSTRATAQWKRLCKKDEHVYWDRKEELELSQTEWRKISERIRADLKSFSRDKNNTGSMAENLQEAVRERYDYTAFLRRFMALGESVQVNDEEFDPVFYTYGLQTYGNMPLVEPLEYRENHRIRDFVIAIDTSASCRGATVQAFLRKTYNIMQESENFFSKINVHIIQCDSEVQQDVKVTERAEFDAFLQNGKLTGFGSTDFRPVFEYVDALREAGEFEDLRGLLYFTDGYGIYPEKMTEYETAFVFLREDDNRPKTPPWAIRLVLNEEEIEA